jgi:hypothetical protein
MSGHFIPSGQSFTIRGKAGTQEKDIDVILTAGLAAGHRVEKKDIPAKIPKSWRHPSGKTRTITWIGNFGLKPAGSTEFVRGEVAEHFEIHLDHQEGQTLVYFDGSGVKPFDQNDLGFPADRPGKIAARLKLGDPPVGWG